LGLFGLSRMRFGVSAEELKAIVEAQGRPSALQSNSAPQTARAAIRAPAPRAPASPATAPRGAGITQGARLVAVERIDPVAPEYSLMKDEISIGRGEDNDVVIPHASVSRAHARLMRRDGGFELMDLNSTNGSYVDEHPVQGSAFVGAGSQLRLGDIRFVLRL
ncbi:MAG: modulated efflux pump with fused ATPase and integral rane subunit, partial [Candidatus Binatus sp.]|nr:modulated efflux pump with fused ATPase and integral rane subunit [Candidatus Binatus sp.]